MKRSLHRLLRPSWFGFGTATPSHSVTGPRPAFSLANQPTLGARDALRLVFAAAAHAAARAAPVAAPTSRAA